MDRRTEADSSLHGQAQGQGERQDQGRSAHLNGRVIVLAPSPAPRLRAGVGNGVETDPGRAADDAVTLRQAAGLSDDAQAVVQEFDGSSDLISVWKAGSCGGSRLKNQD